MSPHPLHRRPLAEERRRSHAQARAANAPPPDPTALLWFPCMRCNQPFGYRGITRHCPNCAGSGDSGEVSGS